MVNPETNCCLVLVSGGACPEDHEPNMDSLVGGRTGASTTLDTRRHPTRGRATFTGRGRPVSTEEVSVCGREGVSDVPCCRSSPERKVL